MPGPPLPGRFRVWTHKVLGATRAAVIHASYPTIEQVERLVENASPTAGRSVFLLSSARYNSARAGLAQR
jgi:hypothetical protein